MRSIASFTFAVLLAFGAAAFTANAAEFSVNTTADTQDASPGDGVCADAAGMCSLRAAITEANASAGADTIDVAAGTYTITLDASNEDANAGGDFDIRSSMTIQGAGSAATIIQGAATANTATERVFHILSAAAATAVTIDGVTVQNGVAPVSAEGGRGGGIKVGNDLTDDAAITFTLTNSLIRRNSSGTRGGGLAINKASSTISNCTFTDNQAGGDDPAGTSGAGGAILIDSQDNVSVPTMTVSISDTVMTGNRARSSVANTFGGALIVRAIDSLVTLTNCTVNNNISDAVNPSFSGFAGGLYNQQAHMRVINCVVNGNASSHFHAGIRNLASTAGEARLEIFNSSINNNLITTDDGQGGGVSNILAGKLDAVCMIDHSTIANNTLSGIQSVGGGLENTGFTGGSASMTVTNSTVSGNTAVFGGGIYSDGSNATLTVDFSTIAANTALPGGEGGGIIQDVTPGGITLLSNSVVADNVAPVLPDIDGEITSLDYNLIEDVTGTDFFPGPHDQTGVDPQLGPLADNGGDTLTHIPASSSPVLDKIPNGTGGCGGPVVNDQRGVVRPFGTACDKGAVERTEGSGTPTPTGSLTPTPTSTPTATPSGSQTPTSTPTGSPTGSPTPFTITPASHDFGVAPIRTRSAAVRFTVRNRTNQFASPMSYSLSAPGGSNFSLELITCGSFLAAGSSCTLDIRFTPSTIGAKSATLIVFSQSVAGIGTASLAGTAVAKSSFDYDLDGRSDISIFRPSTAEWYVQRSNEGLLGMSFGLSTDRPMPTDYDGDGKADIAIYRPSEGLWAIFNSSTQTFSYYLFGYEDDIPVPADYSGDGRADICVFRPTTGTFYWRDSANGLYHAVQFGTSTDRPTIGDFDRDGKADFAVFHPSSGVWYHLLSSTGQPYGERFGIASDVLVPADYDGDAQTDLAVYRRSTGIWYLRMSSTGMWAYRVFGLADDTPAPGDYDGDGLADVGVFRPSNGNWYWQNSSDGSYSGYHFGTNGDVPTQAAFIY